jgi:hypothetical protein
MPDAQETSERLELEDPFDGDRLDGDFFFFFKHPSSGSGNGSFAQAVTFTEFVDLLKSSGE